MPVSTMKLMRAAQVAQEWCVHTSDRPIAIETVMRNVKRSSNACKVANVSPVTLQAFHTRLLCAFKEACLCAISEDIEDDVHPAT